jgi:hypothetical protein
MSFDLLMDAATNPHYWEPKKLIMKKWCKHIRWTVEAVGSARRKWLLSIGRAELVVPHSWKVCPICQTERPTKENIHAAKLQHFMDNDQ